jgi:hypothetical protein
MTIKGTTTRTAADYGKVCHAAWLEGNRPPIQTPEQFMKEDE